MERQFVRELEQRTRTFAIDTVKLSRALGNDATLWPILNQVVRSAGSVSANHHAMSGARSLREFFAKLVIVHEESVESAHWLSILSEVAGTGLEAQIAPLMAEAEELRSIFGRARATTRTRMRG